MTAVGGVGVLSTLVDFLNPAQGEEEKTLVDVDLRRLPEGRAFYAIWLGKPILVAHRTAAQIAEIDKPRAPERTGRFLFDKPRYYNPPPDPAYTHGQRRSLRKNVFVAYGWCTFDVCVLMSNEGSDAAVPSLTTPTKFMKVAGTLDALQCPCCGTYYDMAGRPSHGPGTHLGIPPHWFSDANTLVIGQAPPDPRYPDGGA